MRSSQGTSRPAKGPTIPGAFVGFGIDPPARAFDEAGLILLAEIVAIDAPMRK
jgi:hypothetical protein